MTGCLIVNLGKVGQGGTFGSLGGGREHFWESRLENEISERDLDVGGDGRVRRGGEMVGKGV